MAITGALDNSDTNWISSSSLDISSVEVTFWLALEMSGTECFLLLTMCLGLLGGTCGACCKAPGLLKLNFVLLQQSSAIIAEGGYYYMSAHLFLLSSLEGRKGGVRKRVCFN